MEEQYFNLKIGNPDSNGHVIKLSDEVLTDFINSYSDKKNNLQFKLIEERTEEKPSIYEVTIPDMNFSAGAHVPSLAVNCGTGWYNTGKSSVVRLTLDKEVLRVAEGQENIFIEKISKPKADKMKQDEFNYSMMQLYVVGF
jgi:hypothetical protein